MLGSFLGARIIEDPNLTVQKGYTPRYVRRSWRERLFTRPWMPWKPKRLIMVPYRVPSEKAYHIQPGVFVVHPAMANKMRSALADKALAHKYNRWGKI